MLPRFVFSSCRVISTLLLAVLMLASPALGQSGAALPLLSGDANGSNNRKHRRHVMPMKKQDKRRFAGNPSCLSWIDPDVPTKAAILCVHGLGLHNGTYREFAERMAKLGYATYSVDVRGFGSWQKAKGREQVNFNACLEDVRKTLRVIHRAHPGLPVFLLGESMGGAIALRIASMYPELISGLISSVPAGDRFQQRKTELKVALQFLSGPSRRFDVGRQVVKQATQCENLRRQWQEDPLARLNLSPMELIQFQRFMNENHKSAKKITSLPVLMVQGCKDKLVRPDGTVELFNKLRTLDRQMELIPDAEHLIFEENQFTDEVIQMVDRWMTARLSPPGPRTAAAGSQE